jgi:hypothetical protein
LDAELQGLSAQEAHLQKILDGYAGYLKKLPDKELRLVRLMRDKELNNKIYTRLLEEREQARIREAAEIGNIRIVESAELPRVPARPQKLLNIGIGLLTGTILGLLLVFVAEFARETPRTPEDVERMLKFPVLASVPQIKHGFTFALNGKQPQRALIHHRAAAAFTRDAYAYLWGSLRISNHSSGQVIMITSAGPAEENLPSPPTYRLPPHAKAKEPCSSMAICASRFYTRFSQFPFRLALPIWSPKPLRPGRIRRNMQVPPQRKIALKKRPIKP